MIHLNQDSLARTSTGGQVVYDSLLPIGHINPTTRHMRKVMSRQRVT